MCLRLVVDNTKKPKWCNCINLDNTFSLIFWHVVCLQFALYVMYAKYFHRMESHQNGRPFMSVHFGQSGSCWMPPMFTRNLTFKPSSWSTLTHRAHNGSLAPLLPAHCQEGWFLLLQLLGTDCLSLDKHIQQATMKDTYLWHNMTAEYVGIKKQLQQRKIEPPAYLVQYVSDDNNDVVFIEWQEPLQLKRVPKEDVDVNPQPLQCQHSNTASTTTTPLHLPLSPFSPSPMISLMASPCPVSPTMPIHIPETSKQWPARMYVINMSLGFHQVDQLKTLLNKCLLTMFSKKIPLNTYHDTGRLWLKNSRMISRMLAIHQQVCGQQCPNISRHLFLK